jgi:hypothetical protein
MLQFLKLGGLATLMFAATSLPSMAQTAAVLKDADGKDVGSVILIETPAGVLLKLHDAPIGIRSGQNWIGPPGSSLDTASFIPPPPDQRLKIGTDRGAGPTPSASPEIAAAFTTVALTPVKSPVALTTMPTGSNENLVARLRSGLFGTVALM